jgi:uncharacterized membrane protein (DUF2068 family)
METLLSWPLFNRVSKNPSTESDVRVWLIAVFKLCKALLLLLLGLSIAISMHGHLLDDLLRRATAVSLRQENRYIRTVLSWLGGVNRRTLRMFEISTFFYSSLLFTESIGLFLLKPWAEYLTVFVTASFVPFELFSDARRFGLAKTVVLCTNVAVVWYLLSRLWTRLAVAGRER